MIIEYQINIIGTEYISRRSVNNLEFADVTHPRGFKSYPGVVDFEF